jgi:hypothetical protein
MPQITVQPNESFKAFDAAQVGPWIDSGKPAPDSWGVWVYASAEGIADIPGAPGIPKAAYTSRGWVLALDSTTKK